MPTPTTCGQGLAANASLPSALGDLLGAVAEVLAHHMTALDLGDEDAAPEHEAYARLVLDHREASLRLHEIAERMREAHDLPMGRHDGSALGSPEAVELLRQMVERERALRALLDERAATFEPMLREMER